MLIALLHYIFNHIGAGRLALSLTLDLIFENQKGVIAGFQLHVIMMTFMFMDSLEYPYFIGMKHGAMAPWNEVTSNKFDVIIVQ